LGPHTKKRENTKKNKNNIFRRKQKIIAVRRGYQSD
jgi:hypothetical protein